MHSRYRIFNSAQIARAFICLSQFQARGASQTSTRASRARECTRGARLATPRTRERTIFSPATHERTYCAAMAAPRTRECTRLSSSAHLRTLFSSSTRQRTIKPSSTLKRTLPPHVTWANVAANVRKSVRAEKAVRSSVLDASGSAQERARAQILCAIACWVRKARTTARMGCTTKRPARRRPRRTRPPPERLPIVSHP